MLPVPRSAATARCGGAANLTRSATERSLPALDPECPLAASGILWRHSCEAYLSSTAAGSSPARRSGPRPPSGLGVRHSASGGCRARSRSAERRRARSRGAQRARRRAQPPAVPVGSYRDAGVPSPDSDRAVGGIRDQPRHPDRERLATPPDTARRERSQSPSSSLTRCRAVVPEALRSSRGRRIAGLPQHPLPAKAISARCTAPLQQKRLRLRLEEGCPW